MSGTCVEALRVPGHDYQQRARQGNPLQGIEQQLFLALARAGSEEHPAPAEPLPELRGKRFAAGGGLDVELEVSGDLDAPRAQ